MSSITPTFISSTSILYRRGRHHFNLSPRQPNATFNIRYSRPDQGDSSHQYGVRFRVRPLCASASPQTTFTPVAAAGNDESLPGKPVEHRLSTGVRARTLFHICSSGTLCTMSAKHSGVPFGSHVDYILDAEGRPVVLLAHNATHTKNLNEESRCSLYCQPPSTAGQEGCRSTLVGKISKLPTEEVEELKESYIDIHAHAADALQYPDLFDFYRMDVEDVFFVGGYGVVSQWVDVNHFAQAEPDPLAFDAPGIVQSINADKGEDLRRLCKIFLNVDDVEKCTMTSLDRLGFDLRIWESSGEIREYRVAFREVVSNRFDVQSALVKAFQEAWERENGYDETWAGEDTRPTVLYYAPL